MSSTAQFAGHIRAAASARHPLQTLITFILTDFQPNTNKQAIPRAEAENIINTAPGMPIKIRYDGESVDGHPGARPIGPILKAWIDSDNGSEVIMAEAALWNNEFKDVDAFIKSANAENEEIGTSWELLYESSDKDESGIEWLKDILFTGSAIVKNPAYGKQRTRIMSVAEANAELNTDRLSEMMGGMDALYSILNELWSEVYEKERIESLATSAEGAISMAKDILEEWKKRKMSNAQAQESVNTALESTTTQLEAAKAELDTLRAYKKEREEDDLFNTRKSALAEYLPLEELDKRKPILLGMAQDAFDLYLADLKLAAKRPAIAESQRAARIPDLTGSNGTINIEALASAFNEALKK